MPNQQTKAIIPFIFMLDWTVYICLKKEQKYTHPQHAALILRTFRKLNVKLEKVWIEEKAKQGMLTSTYPRGAVDKLYICAVHLQNSKASY